MSWLMKTQAPAKVYFHDMIRQEYYFPELVSVCFEYRLNLLRISCHSIMHFRYITHVTIYLRKNHSQFFELEVLRCKI